MPNALAKPFKPVHKILISGAWFFIIASLLHLAWAVGMLIDASPHTTVKLYHTIVGGESYDALGLTYSGGLGLAHALAQALVVIAAATMSTFSPAGPRRLKLKRIGHGILTVWAAWWAMEIIRLAAIDGQVDSALQAAFMTSLLGCTAYRAARGVFPGNTRGKGSGARPIQRPDFEPIVPETPANGPAEKSVPSTPTGQFFAAIAPEAKPAPGPDDSPQPKAPRFARFRKRMRLEPDQLHHLRERANDVAKRGHQLVIGNARKVGRRAKPVARTAWRESKNAWRRTIQALKDAEHMKTGDAA